MVVNLFRVAHVPMGHKLMKLRAKCNARFMALVTFQAVLLEFFNREAKRTSQVRLARLLQMPRPQLNKILNQRENKTVQPQHLDAYLSATGMLASQLLQQLTKLADDMERKTETARKPRTSPPTANSGKHH